MLISSIIAILGIGLARAILREPPERRRHRCGERRAAHRLLLHRSYVDEAYDAAIVQPIKRVSTGSVEGR